MEIKAIITGDIKDSKKIEDKSILAKIMEDLCKELALYHLIDNYSIFRGDSLQIMVAKPEMAFYCMLLLRSGLRKSTRLLKKTSNKHKYVLDARLSLGIGKTDFISENLTMSNGEAFEFSGKGLDMIENDNIMFNIETCWEGVNNDLKMSLRFADILISDWTIASSEIMFRKLLYDPTQEQLSKKLGISQPAVHKRLRLANFDLFILYNDYFSKKIKNIIQPTNA